MIKKVNLIKTLKDKFSISVDVLEINPPLESLERDLSIKFLTGGFYNTIGYKVYAFYVSDEEGNILDDEPILHDGGLNSYSEIFEQIGYTFI